MSQDKPRIDPRILRTRKLLKDAFVDLSQEMEIEKITVNRIAERATINRVTFYLHYRDIPDMLEKMAEEMIEDIKNVLHHKPLNLDSVKDKSSWVLIKLLEHIADNAKFYKVVLGSKRTPIFTDRLHEMLSKAVTLRVEKDPFISKAGIQKDIAIWHGSAALIGTIVAWLRNDLPYTPQYLAEQFLLLIDPSYFMD
ncbi:TetR/AcrR family transcriptional regulator [Paenibacillus sp. P96]|uniref:TetR/AcrR family transcriptional regulator n=1 Tax=Paenibacillus zeirhizosphaerae TaxID=2987519 RepID=A0ABT9FQW4_9BACL|nr:TetR/AcrR family transcriptional regulator [Paenibacillus sp. P96]MDP4097128.1 TetR/AcrR family transcriptional regulator [Paenibacillus sp. P96]